MTNEMVIPEHLKQFATAQANADVDSLASASISIPRISLRGRKFRLIEGGEEIKKPSEEVKVVILGVEPGPGLFMKAYYEKGYNSGDSEPPTCASSSGVHPDAWIQNPVAERCMTCPKNQFGSATSTNGKKSKACRDSKRLWVAMADDVEGTVFALGIPVTSLKAVSEYGRQIAAFGLPLSSVITKITMVDTEFPQLEFAHDGFLDAVLAPIAIERASDKNWAGHSTQTFLGHDNTAPSKPAVSAIDTALLEAPKIESTGAPGIGSNW
jgi:hypothetical protein